MTYTTTEVNTTLSGWAESGVTQFYGNDIVVEPSTPEPYLTIPYWGPLSWGTHSINVKRIKLHYFYENGEDVAYFLDIDVNDPMRVKKPMDDIKVGEPFAAKDYLILDDVEGVIDVIGEIVE
jgi:hypothetical protein